MIPLSDENPTKNFPVLTLLLIGFNILVFFYGLNLTFPPSLFDDFGLVPYELVHSPMTTYPTIYSSMFIHSGFMHLAGNMLYLWIFGNNIEDILGKFRFILFYLVCGTIAALGHIATDLNSNIPMVGASGAISGILGSYMVLFPRARVKTLIFLGFFITVIRIPAILLLGLWILIQIINSIVIGPDGPQVAWVAHIGGFLAGTILILPFKNMRP